VTLAVVAEGLRALLTAKGMMMGFLALLAIYACLTDCVTVYQHVYAYVSVDTLCLDRTYTSVEKGLRSLQHNYDILFPFVWA
jgi:hypothetical protein